MKKIMLIVLSIALLTGVAAAAEFELTLRNDLYTNENIDSSYGIVAKLINERNGLYLFGSFSNPTFKWGAQPLANTQIYGIGGGVQKDVSKYWIPGLKIFGHIGYYHPEWEVRGSTREAMEAYAVFKTGHHERDLKDPNPYNWKDVSTFELAGAIGGEVGAVYSYDITDRFSVGGSISYRFLNLRQTINWKDYEHMETDGEDSFWSWDEDVNCGGASIGINLTYTW